MILDLTKEELNYIKKEMEIYSEALQEAIKINQRHATFTDDKNEAMEFLKLINDCTLKYDYTCDILCKLDVSLSKKESFNVTPYESKLIYEQIKLSLDSLKHMVEYNPILAKEEKDKELAKKMIEASIRYKPEYIFAQNFVKKLSNINSSK